MKKIADVISDFGVYGMTVLGVIASKYLPAIMTDGSLAEITVGLPTLGEIASACLIAVLVTVMIERKGDKEGKRKRIKRRFLNAFAYGMMWYQLVQIFFNGGVK